MSSVNPVWYKRSFRRNLVDMHIADWDERFMSQFDVKNYAEMLTLSDVDTAIIYAGSCLGICYWPTQNGYMHKGLKGRDIIGELIAECHSRDIHVIVYFNIWSRWAYDTYPDWRMVNVKGQSLVDQGERYGICCPNSPYRNYVRDQIIDLCEHYDFEGMWIDMIGWFGTVCYCRHCAERYLQETGEPLPQQVDWESPHWVAFQRKREAWMAEFAAMITETAKQRKPGATVVHQVTSGLHGWSGGPSHAFYEQSDYLAGDFNHDPEKQSFICKFLSAMTSNKPIEFMTSRCMDLRYHTTMKSKDLLQAQAYSSLANNASFLFIDAIDPVGTLNQETYDVMRDVFRQTKRYEPYLDPDAEHCVDAGIYINFESLINLSDNGNHISNAAAGFPSYKRLFTITKTCIDHNIAFGIVTEKELSDLSRYQVIILPEVVVLSEKEVEAFRQYVKSGGSLYASRHTSLLTPHGERKEDFQLADVFGVSCYDETPEKETYFAPDPLGQPFFSENTMKYPMWVSSSQLMTRINQDSAKVLATLALPYTHPADQHRFASAISNPPGRYTDIPAVVHNAYGNGQAIYVAGDLEQMEEEPQRRLFATLIRSLYTKPAKWRADAPKPVEFILFHQPAQSRWILNVLNFQREMPNIPVHDVEIEIHMQGKTPGRLLLLPDESPVAYELKDDYVRFRIPRLDIFHMYALEYTITI